MDRIKFSTWLLGQIKRHDPVGDLAREFKADWPARRGCTRIKHVRDLMTMAGACVEARRALVTAAREYHRGSTG